MEHEVILVSAVRASAHGAAGSGFLSDARRLNVLLTRVRRGLTLTHPLTTHFFTLKYGGENLGTSDVRRADYAMLHVCLIELHLRFFISKSVELTFQETSSATVHSLHLLRPHGEDQFLVFGQLFGELWLRLELVPHDQGPRA